MQLFREKKVLKITGPASFPSPSKAWSIHSTSAEPLPTLGTQQKSRENQHALSSTQEESLERLSLRPGHLQATPEHFQPASLRKILQQCIWKGKQSEHCEPLEIFQSS